MIPFAAPLGDVAALHFVERSRLGQSWVMCHEVESTGHATTRNGQKDSSPGSQLWQSHTLSCSAPTQGTLARFAAPGSRGPELRNARLCSMIHYSELLNNSAYRINGICHWNTFHMEPGSLRSSSLQRQQHISPSAKLVLWAEASLEHDNQETVGFLGSFATPGWV